MWLWQSFAVCLIGNLSVSVLFFTAELNFHRTSYYGKACEMAPCKYEVQKKIAVLVVMLKETKENINQHSFSISLRR